MHAQIHLGRQQQTFGIPYNLLWATVCMLARYIKMESLDFTDIEEDEMSGEGGGGGGEPWSESPNIFGKLRTEKIIEISKNLNSKNFWLTICSSFRPHFFFSCHFPANINSVSCYPPYPPMLPLLIYFFLSLLLFFESLQILWILQAHCYNFDTTGHSANLSLSLPTSSFIIQFVLSICLNQFVIFINIIYLMELILWIQ